MRQTSAARFPRSHRVLSPARNWITLPDEVEDAFFPFLIDILDAIHEYIQPFPGYTVNRTCDSAELLCRSQLGI